MPQKNWFKIVTNVRYANIIHPLTHELVNVSSPLPFYKWGLDIMGSFSPIEKKEVYLMEHIILQNGSKLFKHVIIRNHIITSFDIPHTLATDNGQ